MSHHHSTIASYLFEHARDIMLVIDADDGRIMDANNAAERSYGYSHDELLARTVFDLRTNEPDVVTAQMRVANTQGVLFEAVHRRRDGSTFPVEVSSQGETIGSQRTLLSVVRDITERQRLQREREALIETTQRALELRDEFLLVASHELRSPVTNVSLQLQHLMRLIERSELVPQFATATKAAIGELTRLTGLISTLLDAQAARGDIVLAKGPVDLAEVVDEITRRLRTRTDLVSPLVVKVPQIRGEWDRLRLEQVITNLLINAHKYGRGRQIDIVGTVEDCRVHLEIRDQGIGISKDDAGRIFDKFERAVPAAYGGFGLGLYITRRIVEAHGGCITLHSTLGEGSTFRVTLPLS